MEARPPDLTPETAAGRQPNQEDTVEAFSSQPLGEESFVRPAPPAVENTCRFHQAVDGRPGLHFPGRRPARGDLGETDPPQAASRQEDAEAEPAPARDGQEPAVRKGEQGGGADPQGCRGIAVRGLDRLDLQAEPVRWRGEQGC